MKLILLRSTCGETRTCPNINITDRRTYVVQGALVTGLDLDGHVLRSGEAVVEIPSSLLPELSADDTAHGAARHSDRGTVLVCGRLIVDTEVLRVLDLPDGEAAVEVPIGVLPKLEFVHAE